LIYDIDYFCSDQHSHLECITACIVSTLKTTVNK